MNREQEYFLQALRGALRGERVGWAGEVDWPALFRLAGQQNVLPLIYEAVCGCPAARSEQLPEAHRASLAVAGRDSRRAVMFQALRTEQFLRLYAHLRAQGQAPLVVKGIICRSLYPNPDFRLSADEDLLVTPEAMAACEASLEAFGLACKASDPAADEKPYMSQDGALYVELHSSLFPAHSEAYGDLARLFDGACDRAVTADIGDTVLYTLEATDHLLYLLCHALKHFLHAGFGIRQVCDIVLYAEAYGPDIDWQRIRRSCAAIRAECFAQALFAIGAQYLGVDPADLPDSWRSPDIDCRPLLEDLLDAGIYGGGTASRHHSGNMTLHAVASDRNGRKGSGLAASLFPPLASLRGRYPYLVSRPWLLPVAWCSRLVRYGRQDADAADTVRIGKQRIELLRQYGILPKK